MFSLAYALNFHSSMLLVNHPLLQFFRWMISCCRERLMAIKMLVVQADPQRVALTSQIMKTFEQELTSLCSGG